LKGLPAGFKHLIQRAKTCAETTEIAC